MKRSITILVLCLNSIYAFTQEVKYINASELNMRNGAGKNFDIVAKASKNEKVIIISEQNNWTEIETENGTRGFVSSDFLANSITDDNEYKTGDNPFLMLIGGGILIYLIFRFKKFLNNIFKSSSKKSNSNKTTTKVVNKPKEKNVFEKTTKNVPKEIDKKEVVICKNCGSQYANISLLTMNNCKNTNGKHELYEGKIKSQYDCKYCGAKYNSVFQMTINNCKKSPVGKHRPAL